MKPTVKDIDHGFRGLFTRALAQSKNKENLIVTVGVQGAEGAFDHEGISTARLAGVHEFGAEIAIGSHTVKIPERSFIRSTVDAHDSFREEIRSVAAKVLLGALTARVALTALGEKISSEIKRTIERGVEPPNAAGTIAAKGSSKPLIDSGQLKNSITYDVHPDDGRNAL